MAGITFAAIDIGSYNISMEIFEILKNGIKPLTSVRSRLELGSDTFNLKKITVEKLNSLLEILTDYKRIMAEFGVTDYRACAKSALREAKNRAVVIESVYQNVGIQIDVISNSEQRFLGYKAVASKGTEFKKYIETGTAIVDLGGGSVQISLFDKDSLVSTQNVKIGSVRMKENLAMIERFSRNYADLVEEYISRDLKGYKAMYLKERKIDNVIIIGDYFTNLIFQNKNDASKIETREEFKDWYDHVMKKSSADLAKEMGVGPEMAAMVIPTAVLYKRLIEELGASTIWLPGIQLTDGIVYDYADRNKLIRSTHNFDKDILVAARNIARRYVADEEHTDYLIKMSDAFFNALKKDHGFNERDHLVLMVSCILNDCGRYVSMRRSEDCAYEIVMATEIIGLSDMERTMIAHIVRASRMEFDYEAVYEEREIPEYKVLKIAKLTAILRLADALDQSRKQKAESISISIKKRELTVTIDSKDDFTLEKGFFERKSDFFEEVYCLETSLKMKGRKGK